MRAMWVLRCIILALGALLAVALIARGNVFIGVIVGALVVARAVLFAGMTRRRRAFRRRIRERMANRR